MSEDLLPPNATPQERALANTVARVSAIPVLLRDLWSANTCPAALLPWLAWGMSVDEWDSSWTEQQKRNVIASSVEIHRKKGTIGAVKRIIESFNLGIAIKEWWETTPPGVPHTFKLILSLDTIPIGAREAIIEAIKRVKPVRSDFALEYTPGYSCPVNVTANGQVTVFQRFSAVLTIPE